MLTKTNILRMSAAFCVAGSLFAPSMTGAFSLPAACADLSLAALDSDGDKLDDRHETCVTFTDPGNADTDGDGMHDADEIIAGRSPHHAGKRLIDVDSDLDFLNDDWELRLGTGLTNPDSDGDLYLDGTEVAASFDPRDPGPTKMEKLIRVNDKGLRLTYSMNDIVLGVLPVSTGKPSTPTPHGEFSILDKIPVKIYRGPTWNYPNTKWNLWFTNARGWRYYIHGAYWHDKFGAYPVSGGCVNVRYEDMEHLYWWAQHGTKVIVE